MIRLLWRPLGFSLNKCVPILYAYKLSLRVSSKCIHPNYYFYCFECVHRVCPNLSSSPCTVWWVKFINFFCPPGSRDPVESGSGFTTLLFQEARWFWPTSTFLLVCPFLSGFGHTPSLHARPFLSMQVQVFFCIDHIWVEPSCKTSVASQFEFLLVVDIWYR